MRQNAPPVPSQPSDPVACGAIECHAETNDLGWKVRAGALWSIGLDQSSVESAPLLSALGPKAKPTTSCRASQHNRRRSWKSPSAGPATQAFAYPIVIDDLERC